MSRRQHKKVRHALVDIALLTCGVVDLPVFRDCVAAIKREMEDVEANFHVFFQGVTPENKQPFTEIINTVSNAQLRTSNENVGYSYGANRAIKMGSAPLVLFITDDVVLDTGTLRKLVDTMRDEQIGLCGLKLTFPKNSTDKGRPAGRVQHIGHAIDLHGEVTHPLMGWRPENPKCNTSREVQSVTGAVFMVRRNLFLKAGGFFEGYGRGYFEDVDLCLTLRQMGSHIFINTEATAEHYTNASMLKIDKPIPMNQNRQLLIMRRGNQLIHDSWSFW